MQQAVDPAIYTELEQLRGTKMTYEGELTNLRNQVVHQQEEKDQLQARLSQTSRQVFVNCKADINFLWSS